MQTVNDICYMKSYLDVFLQDFGYPKEACDALEEAFDKIYADRDLKCRFEQVLNDYKKDMRNDFSKMMDTISETSAQAGIHEYTGWLLFVICLSEELKRYYQEAEIDTEIWNTSMNDLKWKMMECKLRYDIWGTFVPMWYAGFFALERFGFGKLQFELKSFNSHYKKNGVRLKPDDIVVNVHIPRTGTSLDVESKKESYRKAAAFFADKFGDKPVVFVTRTWMLFPRNREILAPDSNFYGFMSDYDIVEYEEYEDYEEVWRIFGVSYTGQADILPQNTTMQRAYKKWIENHEKTGWGRGVFVYK